jgi:hypothetical protein
MLGWRKTAGQPFANASRRRTLTRNHVTEYMRDKIVRARDYQKHVFAVLRNPTTTFPA